MIAPAIQSAGTDLCPGKRRQKFSVTVNIAVSVEAAATEPGALEFTGVESTSAW